MAKLSKKDMEELRETCSYGCEYSATRDAVQVIVYETLEELGGTDLRYADEIGLTDGDNEFSTLDDFVPVFWDKAVEKILNVVSTQ